MSEFTVRTISGNHCTVHTGSHYHRPTPYRTVIHHIWPRGDGGPDVHENTVLVCDTGHFNIHFNYDLLKKHGKDARLYGTFEEKYYASLGYRSYITKSLEVAASVGVHRGRPE